MSDMLGGIDPRTMAENMAYYDVMAQRGQVQMQQKLLAAQKDALKLLRTGLGDFRKAISDLNKINEGVLQTNAKQSVEGMANIKTNSNASKGSYSFYVEELAKAHQIAFENISDQDIANDQGTLSLKLGDKTVDIDLTNVNELADLASEINGHADNPGVTASVVRNNGELMLMLQSNETGEVNQIEITSNNTWLTNAQRTEISPASDAKVWLGDKDKGVLLTNSSNTFDKIIDGVSIEFTRTHKKDDPPLNVTIGTDNEGTKEKLNVFIDSYNDLLKSLDDLTKRGSGKDSGGAFAGDSSIMSLKSQLNSLIRGEFGEQHLAEFGITADREGRLKLDGKRLDEKLKSDPSSLTDFFNNGEKGLLKGIDKALDIHLSSNGQLKQRQDSLDRRETQLQSKSDMIEARYDSAYNRYLAQFSQLQKIMTQMNSTMGMFSSF